MIFTVVTTCLPTTWDTMLIRLREKEIANNTDTLCKLLHPVPLPHTHPYWERYITPVDIFWSGRQHISTHLHLEATYINPVTKQIERLLVLIKTQIRRKLSNRSRLLCSTVPNSSWSICDSWTCLWKLWQDPVHDLQCRITEFGKKGMLS